MTRSRLTSFLPFGLAMTGMFVLAMLAAYCVLIPAGFLALMLLPRAFEPAWWGEAYVASLAFGPPTLGIVVVWDLWRAA